MEVLNSDGSNDDLISKIDFRQFIKNIELNCQKSIINRKNKILLKQKIKHNWLNKSKIIPPSFPKLQENIAFHTIDSLKPLSLYQNKFTNDFIQVSLTSTKTQQKFKSLGISRTSNDFRKAISCDRIKTNWKLQLRKDQLNILKYVKNNEKESLQPESTIKLFKVRKTFKKIGLSKSQMNSLHKTKFDKDNYRQRFKTLQSEPSANYLM